jgi:hypothetical protein
MYQREPASQPLASQMNWPILQQSHTLRERKTIYRINQKVSSGFSY